MALFGLFNKKNENKTIPFQFTSNTPDSSLEEVTNEAPVVEETTPENKPLTVSYATGWPIDIIYGYHLDTRIETCNAAGLLTTAADLNKHMAVINAHKEELSLLEHDFRNNANEASVPLMSYECGFLRGVSTIAMAGPNRTQTVETPISQTLNAQSIAVK